MLIAQGNLANTYQLIGRLEEGLRMRRDVYAGFLKLKGEAHRTTLITANHYASTLLNAERFKEAESLLRKTLPVARRVLGDLHELTLRMRWNYACALYEDDTATLDDIQEAVTTLEDTAWTARRVLGGAHPLVVRIDSCLKEARAALRAREA